MDFRYFKISRINILMPITPNDSAHQIIKSLDNFEKGFEYP